MNRRYTFIGLVAATVVVAGAFVKEPLRQFLFAPEGLSLAPSNICLNNESGETVVVTLAVEGGEKAIALLSNGESECAASPEHGRDASISVGVTEQAEQACEYASAAGNTITLQAFTPPADCRFAG